MARFDIHAWPDGDGYLLDCQADLLSHFKTRLVVPLIKEETTPPSLVRLHPIFEIDGIKYLMATQLMASVPLSALGPTVSTLIAHDVAILAAIDVLISGY
jgi:toxin CcdB